MSPSMASAAANRWPVRAENVGARGDASGLRDRAAVRAGEAVGPADALHVGGAVRVVRKELLEFGEGTRERKLARHLCTRLDWAQVLRLNDSSCDVRRDGN